VTEPYSTAVLKKGLLQTGMYVFGGSITLQMFAYMDWQLDVLATSLAVVCGLVVFLAWPMLRRPQ